MLLTEMENLIKDLTDIRGQLDELRDEEKKLNEAKGAVEAKIMEQLKAVGNDSYKSSLGTAYISTSLSYKMPKDEQNRSELFEYLQKQNTFDTLITINSQTFNAWCKAETEAAKAAGTFPFAIPGVEDPISYETIRFRKN